MSTYLIIGVNKGLGLEFLTQLGANPKNTIVGTVRKGANLDKVNALKYPNLKLINVDMAQPVGEFKAAFSALEALTPNGIDVVIHNAGTADLAAFSPLHVQDTALFGSLFDINAVGAVKTYQAIYPRLETNGKPVKLVYISSISGSIGGMYGEFGSYGLSKAALNFVVKQISRERKDKGDIVVPLHPGLVNTDMISAVEELVKNSIPTSQSVGGLLSVIDGLKLEDTGKFFSYEGEELVF